MYQKIVYDQSADFCRPRKSASSTTRGGGINPRNEIVCKEEEGLSREKDWVGGKCQGMKKVCYKSIKVIIVNHAMLFFS